MTPMNVKLKTLVRHDTEPTRRLTPDDFNRLTVLSWVDAGLWEEKKQKKISLRGEYRYGRCTDLLMSFGTEVSRLFFLKNFFLKSEKMVKGEKCQTETPQ